MCITHPCSFAGKELADLGAAGAQLHTQIFKIMVAVGSLAVLPALAKVTTIYTIILQTCLLLLLLATFFLNVIVSQGMLVRRERQRALLLHMAAADKR